jgi:prepilin-type processing-associated H-X9-DG protein
LLLPAVQAAREAARKARCNNNVKQLVLAMQNYHNLHKMFPINWGLGNTTGYSTKGFSWMCMILPLIEQEQLYKRINFESPLGGPTSSNNLASGTPVPAFHCPSDTHEGTLENQVLCSGVTNYKAVAGANWPGTSSGLFGYKKADAGFGGRNALLDDGFDFGDGVICRGDLTNSKQVFTTAVMQVRDGTSHTFAIGEAIPEWCNWSSWYYYDGATATCAIPLNWKKPGSTPADVAAIKLDCYSFRSRHSGGAIFGFCDGHTKFISQDIELPIYRALATIDGGEIPGEW